MNRLLPVALAVLAAAPAFAGELDLPESIGDLRAGAPAVPVPAPSARASYNPPPENPGFTLTSRRRVELIGRAAEWRGRKEDMRQALQTFYGAMVSRDGGSARWSKLILQVWTLLEQVERVQGAVSERLSARVSAEVSDPTERDRRLAIIATRRDFRRLIVWGNMAPRIIDECSEDSRGIYDGRLYAGPTWGIALTIDEGNAISRELTQQIGFPVAEIEALEKTVSDEDKAAHPEAK